MHTLLHFKEAILDHGESMNDKPVTVVSCPTHFTEMQSEELSFWVWLIVLLSSAKGFLTKGQNIDRDTYRSSFKNEVRLHQK